MGLDRGELNRLAETRQMISSFDKKKLSPQGWVVLVDDNQVKLPSGEIVENGLSFRNNFHFQSDASADLFVPCGGRPDSININNVENVGFQKEKLIFLGFG